MQFENTGLRLFYHTNDFKKYFIIGLNEMDMKIVTFSTKNDEHQKKILDAVPEMFPKKNIICHARLDDFQIEIRDMLLGCGIILIVIRDRHELEQIQNISRQLEGHQFILILDPSIEELTYQALKLFPRYSSYLKDNYKDVFLVLERMITNIEKKGDLNGRGC